ncbi:MAG: DUF839 domain-containing protein [Planctomycetota bacterium]|nr:DUF839 domain-containing protein [Planctomycetota bacterium]
MAHTRREFLNRGTAFTLGFAGLSSLYARHKTLASALEASDTGFGPLIRDPRGIIDLPAGFTYSTFSRAGEEMDDGFLLPGKHDGMAAFRGENNRVILVRNHEMDATDVALGPFGADNARLSKLAPDRMFDAGGGRAPELGGTTTVVYNQLTGKVERQFMSLFGTARNCAGGPTPWNSWLTCEETALTKGEGREHDHGWVFEVPAGATGAVKPEPITAMGRFRHEAVAFDPRSGAVYQTEDVADAGLYRYLPKERTRLLAGGRLQALCVADRATLDTRNWDKAHQTVKVGEKLRVRWVDLVNVEAPKDDLRTQAQSKGGAIFARCEGIWYGDSCAYFASTSGGSSEMGQLWKYTPSQAEGTPDEEKNPGILELMLEVHDSKVLNNADNLTVAPWGDLIVCEDGDGANGLVGVTPDGIPYRLAMTRVNTSETAGACFSPDGSTLFMNIQHPGLTLAIRGPWKKR